jgi:hypothetical protein
MLVNSRSHLLQPPDKRWKNIWNSFFVPFSHQILETPTTRAIEQDLFRVILRSLFEQQRNLRVFKKENSRAGRDVKVIH